MKFIVRPNPTRNRNPITMCAQCREDPRFCGELI